MFATHILLTLARGAALARPSSPSLPLLLLRGALIGVALIALSMGASVRADPLSAGLYNGDTCARPIRVGYLPGRAPYQMMSETGDGMGVDVEIARRIVTGIGCTADLVPVGWPRALPLLERGMIDMLPGASFSEDRAAFALFSVPYRHEEFALYVRAGQVGAFPLTSLADVGEMRFHLALNADALYGPDVSALLDQPTFRESITFIKGIEQPALVSIGRVDGYLLDTGVASAYNASVIHADRLERHPSVTIDNGPIHFMFSRATVSQAFVDRINGLIDAEADDRGESR